ncbi:UvrABC system protein C [bacterium BMS3Bbin06]|nr:UvrABC system protein C [bacterium BMS3Bbin06]
MHKTTEAMRKKLNMVPDRPGVYIFKDEQERILYIGKAKRLKNRLRSYFRRSASLEPRKTAMMRKVVDFSYVITGSELEALALEVNLIKQHRPRYNVVLRDDKNYPYLRLTVKERWPRLEVVRRIKKDGSIYFGPYIPASSMWETLAFIRRHFHIRPCRYSLDRPMRPCIQFQMRRCPAPCAGLVPDEEYIQSVKEVERFLKGEKKELIEELQEKMYRLSDTMRYEEAAKIRDSLHALRIAFDSQRVISPELGDIDVIGSYQEGKETVFQVFFIRNGILIGGKDFYLKDTGYIPHGELLEGFIESFYVKVIIPPGEVLAEIKPSGVRALRKWLAQRSGEKVTIKIPESTKEKDLIAMAQENAKTAFLVRKGVRPEEILRMLGKRLGLSRMPSTIGAFDVSTISGSYSVGSFVWWEDGSFRKERYRHLRIKTVEGVDDYSMMSEIVKRTVRNLGEELPDLIIIDGGKAQLEVAMKALHEVPGSDREGVDMVGIAKRPDRAVLPNGELLPINDGKADALLLKRVRDEAHRFAVSYHRKLRGKGLLESRLEGIKGIGKKRRLALLRHFGSVAAVGESTVEEIASVEGMSRKLAELLLQELPKHTRG